MGMTGKIFQIFMENSLDLKRLGTDKGGGGGRNGNLGTKNNVVMEKVWIDTYIFQFITFYKI
jgi:hypothetical protein